MPTPSESITQIYAGYYNRAPDPEGLNYWVGRFNAGMSLLDIAQSFSVQPETVVLYSFLTSGGSPTAFLNSVYNNLLARAPDAPGAAYWTAQLASSLPVGRIIIDIISGAQGNDILLINNKVAVGQHFVNELQRLNAPFNMDVAKGAYASVTSNTASVTTAISVLAALVPGLAPLPVLTIDPPGIIFTLTTGVDNFTGTGSNDIFNAIVDSDAGSGQTLTGGDIINGDGGAGDVLNILINPASAVAMPAVFITNVEVINLRNISGNALTFNAGTVIGETNVNVDRSTSEVTITNLAAGASVGVNRITGSGNVEIGYAETGGTAIVNMSSNSLELLASPALIFTSAPTTIIINSLPGANNNHIFDLDPGAAVQTLIINAAAPFTSHYGVTQDNFDISTLKTVIVTGAASNYVTSQNTNQGLYFDGDTPAVFIGYPDATTIDASAMTVGGIEAYVSDGVTANAIVKGGQGGDRIGGSDGNDVIQGNGGNDTIHSDKGMDTLSGGAGADTFVYDLYPYYAGQGVFLTGLTTGDTITDFAPGIDRLEFSNGTTKIFASAQQAAVQTAVSALGAGATPAQIAAAMAMANTSSNAVALAAIDGDTYVYYEKTGASVGVSETDAFIKLTGVTTTLNVTIVPTSSFYPVPENSLLFDTIIS